MDTTLTNNKLDVVAYVARHLTLGDRPTSLAQEFQQVPCEVRTVEVERLGSEPCNFVDFCIAQCSCSCSLLYWDCVLPSELSVAVTHMTEHQPGVLSLEGCPD